MSNADGLSVRCHGHGEHDQYKADLSTSFNRSSYIVRG